MRRRLDRSRYAARLRPAGPQAIAVPSALSSASVAPPAPPVPSGPVALVCNGPSCRESWSDDKAAAHGLVICVNTAAWFFRCDWMAVGDRPVLEPVLAGKYPRPRIGFITNLGLGKMCRDRGLHAVRGRVLAGEIAGLKATSYTMPNALEFAVREADRLGVHVEIHGFDATHGPDVAGINRHGTHAGARWRDEARWLRPLWRPTIVCHGRAPAKLLAYLRGEAKEYRP